MLKSGKDIVQYFDRLLSNQVTWQSHWQEIAEYTQPRKARINRGTSGPSSGIDERLFDSTGVDCTMQLAGGQLSWITPATEEWFLFKPDNLLEGDDEVEGWLEECTSIIREMLAVSNFYTEVHEMYLDRSGFGTGCLYTDYDAANRRLYFRTQMIGSYVCAENALGAVDTVLYARTLTARAAKELFGEQALPVEVAKDAADPEKWLKEHCFIHAVFPRREFKAGNPFSSNYPIASVWVHKASFEIVQESGYLEMPYMVTRFLRWEQSGMFGVMPSASDPYGWSPGWAAMPDLRQLNYLEKIQDALADRLVNPPILWPEELDGRANLRPGGHTLYNSTLPNAKPEEWLTQGRYDVGQLRAEEKRNRVKDVFMVRLFSMFAGLDPGKQMTAYEVRERVSEKIDQISPSFGLLTTELLTPLLKRCFSQALANNRLPQPPRQVIAQNPASGDWEMLAPKIEFTSRLALAISYAQVHGFERALEFLERVAQFRPEVLDNVDFDEAARRALRSNGVDQKIIVPKRRMEAERMARAQMAAQAVESGAATPV